MSISYGDVLESLELALLLLGGGAGVCDNAFLFCWSSVLRAIFARLRIESSSLALVMQIILPLKYVKQLEINSSEISILLSINT